MTVEREQPQGRSVSHSVFIEMYADASLRIPEARRCGAEVSWHLRLVSYTTRAAATR